jgi:hypothetical protein
LLRATFSFRGDPALAGDFLAALFFAGAFALRAGAALGKSISIRGARPIRFGSRPSWCSSMARHRYQAPAER